MSEFKFSCPFCEQHLQCDEQLSGRQIQCPRCNHLLRVPAVPGKTVQYDPQSGMTWATYIPSGKPSAGQAPPGKPIENQPKNKPPEPSK